MLESLKRILAAGLGAASFSAERLRVIVDDLVRRGELTQEQADRVLGELLRHGKVEGRSLVARLSRDIVSLAEKGPFVTRREFRALLERVRALEGGASSGAPDEVDPEDTGSVVLGPDGKEG
jgi:polyhydroxyalkanoate synthesis regulator phasin